MVLAHPPETPIGYDPNAEPMDYTARALIGQQEEIIRLLASLESNIDRLANYAERQRGKEAPEYIDLGPLSGKNGAGTAAGVVFQTTQRFRVTHIIMGGGVVNDNLRFKIGQLPFNFYTDGSTVSIPFEIEIDRGYDINVADITTPGNIAWTFMIAGYPE